jgi:hypothetical protein
VRFALSLADLPRHDLHLGRHAVAKVDLHVNGAVAARVRRCQKIIDLQNREGGGQSVAHVLERAQIVNDEARAKVIRDRLRRARSRLSLDAIQRLGAHAMEFNSGDLSDQIA